MKKFILFNILFISFIFCQFRLGYDLSGYYYNYDLGDKFNLKNKYTNITTSGDTKIIPMVIGFDYNFQYKELKYGLGLEFMSLRGFKEYSNGKVAFHSLYGFGKYKLYKKLYGLIKVGYNSHTGNSSWNECYECNINLYGGIMYGYGIGFGNFEFTYIINNASAEIDLINNSNFHDQNLDIQYSRFNISLIFNTKMENIYY